MHGRWGPHEKFGGAAVHGPRNRPFRAYMPRCKDRGFNYSQPLSIWWEEQWGTRPSRLKARRPTARHEATASSTTMTLAPGAGVVPQTRDGLDQVWLWRRRVSRRGFDEDASVVGVAQSEHSTTTATTKSLAHGSLRAHIGRSRIVSNLSTPHNCVEGIEACCIG
jgi:hypothetical protein